MKNKGWIGILLVFFLTACGNGGKKEQDKIKVVTSFYPIYLLTQEVVKDGENIILENMAQPQTGCLHDYELTIGDMKKLEDADILIINGGGMESFLEQAVERYPQLQVVDASKGIKFLTGGHEHHGEENEQEEEQNAHVWLNPKLAQVQVENIATALGQADGQEALLFQNNAEAFGNGVEVLLDTLPMGEDGQEVAVFHEGFDYITGLFGWESGVCISIDEYRMPSAKELAAALEEAKEEDISLFFAAADDGEKYARLLAEERNGRVVMLDPLTTAGEGDYFHRMGENFRQIALALEEGRDGNES